MEYFTKEWWDKEYPQATKKERFEMTASSAMKEVMGLGVDKGLWIKFFNKYGPKINIEDK